MNDLFQKNLPGASSAAQSGVEPPQSKTLARQYLRNTCDCGAQGGWREVQHYDVVRCKCGAYFWALQPRRNGPLVAYPYPRITA